jgi:hypothetical protein
VLSALGVAALSRPFRASGSQPIMGIGCLARGAAQVTCSLSSKSETRRDSNDI